MKPREGKTLHRALLRLFPGEFRAEFAEEMDETFGEQRRAAARRGRGALLALWLRTLGGGLRGALREHGDLIRSDVAVALRGLRRRPGFTLPIVATLGLGLGAHAAVFACLDAVLLRPLTLPSPERLVTIGERDDDAGEAMTTSYATYLDLAERAQTLEALTVMGNALATFGGAGDEAELVHGLRVTRSFFTTLGLPPALGRGFVAEEDRRGADSVVILSHELWQRRFAADPRVVGRTVQLAGRPARVVGVLPASLPAELTRGLYGERLDFLLPLRYAPGYGPACRTCRHLKAIGRVRQGVSVDAAAAEIDGVLQALAGEHPDAYATGGAVVRPLQAALVGGAGRPLLALWGAVACVLLIAASNVAGLLLARTAERERELSLRAALGARRSRLFRQLATESLVLALLGGALATALAWAVVRLVAGSPAVGLLRIDTARLDGRTLVALLAAAAAIAAAVTLAPAMRALRGDLRSRLQRGGRGASGGRAQRGRGALAVGQMALAMVLLATTGLLLGSLRHLLQQDPGFDPAGVVTAEVTLLTPRYDEAAPSVAFLDRVLERVRALPGVEAAGALHIMPAAGERDRYGFHLERLPLEREALAPDVLLYRAAPGTERALRLRLLAGRFLTAADREGALRVTVLGEGAASELGWPRRSPLGERVQFGARGDDWRTVVGVVGDVRHEGLDQAPPLQAYVPFAQDFPWRMVLFARTGGDPAQLAEPLRRAVAAVDPQVPVRGVRTVEEVLAGTMASRRLGLWLLGGFAVLALLLAAVGLYGLLAYGVAQRRRELGIRQALGAGPREVLALVLRQGLGRAGLGVLIGWPLAWLAARWVRSLLFEVEPADLGNALATIAVLLATAVVASWLPARRAAAIDPAVVLHED